MSIQDKLKAVDDLLAEAKEEVAKQLEGKTIDADDLYGYWLTGPADTRLELNPNLTEGYYNFNGVSYEVLEDSADYHWNRVYTFEVGFDRDALGWYTSHETAVC